MKISKLFKCLKAFEKFSKLFFKLSKIQKCIIFNYLLKFCVKLFKAFKFLPIYREIFCWNFTHNFTLCLRISPVWENRIKQEPLPEGKNCHALAARDKNLHLMLLQHDRRKCVWKSFFLFLLLLKCFSCRVVEKNSLVEWLMKVKSCVVFRWWVLMDAANFIYGFQSNVWVVFGMKNK